VHAIPEEDPELGVVAQQLEQFARRVGIADRKAVLGVALDRVLRVPADKRQGSEPGVRLRRQAYQLWLGQSVLPAQKLTIM
jgi:hypothetical protein